MLFLCQEVTAATGDCVLNLLAGQSDYYQE